MIPTERLRELAAYASDPCADLQHQLAAELLAAREAERELVDVLRRNGFRKCDVPACNCDSWHQVDGYAARFREIDDAIGDHNGKTLLQAVQEVLAERDAARESMSLPGYQRLVDERDAALAELSALHARIEHSHNGYQETGKALGMDRPASHLIALGELLTEQVELADSVVRIERDEARAEAKKYHDALVARHGGEPVALLSELDAARAELAKLRGREAEPFDWDALPTVEDWVAEHLPEKEPRAGSQMAEVRADEVIADRGELRRVAGWLKDLLAENARAHAEEMQWPDQVAEALGTTRDRIGATPSMVAGVVAKMRAELAADQPKPAGGA